MATRIGLLLFDDVDLLDVGGPYEVLLTANRLALRAGEPAPFDVVTIADRERTVPAYGGLGLHPQAAADAVGDLDVLLVPGLVDVERGVADEDLISTVRRLAARSAMVTSVCTGAFLLAHAGVAADRLLTTHHEDVEGLGAVVGPDHVTTARWVDAGDVVTAGGLSSGIAMALHLVERLAGRDLAVRTARQIEYTWDPDDGVVVSG